MKIKGLMNEYQKINFISNWQVKNYQINYKPRQIFSNIKSIELAYLAFSFYLTIMSCELLLNQPFKRKINLFHNIFFGRLLGFNIATINRIEINTFAFSLFLILHKLFETEKIYKFSESKLILYSISHWSCIKKFSEKKNTFVRKEIFKIWQNKSKLIRLCTKESKIDLIIDLYKSFELGISDKEIIKDNLANLSFSVSKSSKEFRFDVLKYFKKAISNLE